MGIKIYLNETPIDTTSFENTTIIDEVAEKMLHKIIIDFAVQSSMYHDITVLLYENNFDVRVPEKDLAFKGTIYNYSTSITNLYEENQVANFHLELIEKV